MSTLRWLLFLLLLGLFLLPASAPGQSKQNLSILVYSHTDGYRHKAIPTGIDALQSISNEHGWTVNATEDPSALTANRLSSVDVVIFLNTSEDVLGSGGERALRSFVENGGGFVGIHSAADTEYDWPWYGRLVGAYFDGHPEIQEATVRREDARHPSTEMLSEEWVRRDEWYNYRSNPRDSVRVLLTLDESTYEGGTMGDDHPIAWCQTVDEGRSWYTGGGHTRESYSDPDFRAHLAGGIQWAAGTGQPNATEE